MLTIKNKKGASWITLLVFMALALVVIALFTFVSSSIKVERQISGANQVEKFYDSSSLFENYLENIAYLIVKTNPKIDSREFIAKFREEAVKNLPEDYSKYSSELQSSQIESIIKNNLLSFSIKNFKFDYIADSNDKFGITNINYVKNLNFRIDF